MFDKELAIEILNQILTSSQIILKRFKSVNTTDDFTNSEAGMEKLDSICMQLITIGENLKNLDKVTNQTLLKKYPQVEWKKAKGLRDIITHHYSDLNEEAIFDVCENKIEELSKVIKIIIQDLK